MDMLKDLIRAHGPSGSEGPVRDFIKKHIKPYVDELYTDKFGNLVGRKKGKGTSVMLVAHMDEIGIMVKYIDRDGKIYLSPIGGIEPLTLIGETVNITTNKGKVVCGVITTKEIHDSEELTQLPNMEDIYVDTGLSKEDLCDIGVYPGDYAYFLREPHVLGDNNFISGKALDDRIGCYILLELAKKLKSHKGEIFFVFTVQEEIGLYGAKTSVYSIDPDYAIILDVTEADDGHHHYPAKRLGGGPILLMKDAEMITNKCLNDHIRMLAKKQKINIQPDIGNFGTTDALSISVSRGGIPSTVLGVPVRNIHTTSSISNINDIKDAIKLVSALLKDTPKVCFT